MLLPPFSLERYFAAYEFAVPHHLCASDCESFSTAELLALEPGAREGFLNLRHGYTESQGSPELRSLIADTYQDISQDQVLVCSGAEEAIFLFMNALLEPGQRVVLQRPCYQSLGQVAMSLGAEVVDWALGEGESAWFADWDALFELLTPKTKLLVINFPHNPTGVSASQAELERLAAHCRKNGIVVFSDEVYRFGEYDPGQTPSAFSDLYENALSLGVMSKPLGLPGLRIGWAASRDAAIMERMAQLKDYTTICNSAPSEYLACLGLKHKDRLLERNRGVMTHNLSLLNGFMQRHSAYFAWREPDAGSIAFPRYLGKDCEAFCNELAQKAGVLLLPGRMYGIEYSQNFRIGIGRKSFPQGLAKLEEYLLTQG